MTDLTPQRVGIKFNGRTVLVAPEVLDRWEALAGGIDERFNAETSLWGADPGGWVCTLTDAVLNALDEPQIGTDADLEFRTDALIGLVMQLVTAFSEGSEITVGAVISAARAAFPDANDLESLARIGAAGMCVMWANVTEWFDAHRYEFGGAVLAHAEGGGEFYRPNAFRGLA